MFTWVQKTEGVPENIKLKGLEKKSLWQTCARVGNLTMEKAWHPKVIQTDLQKIGVKETHWYCDRK